MATPVIHPTGSLLDQKMGKSSPGKIGGIMRAEAPALFGDYTITDGTWIPNWRKV